MDLSSLAELGKVAGVAGVAIGMIVLLARPIIERTSSLPRAERGPMLRFIATGAFAIGALGIVAWLVAGMQMGTSVKSGDCSIATNGTVTGNTVNCGAPPAVPAAKP
jgi:hypothetical protein